jgi:uncharacterized protein YuzE
MPNAKLNKPPIFTGKDLSLATVNTWAVRAEDYVDDTPDEARKIKVAGSFLTETAELWYITTIRSCTPMLPTFAAFILAFKKHFSRADEPHILRDQLQQMSQGDRNVIDYLAEFETVVAQIGPSGDQVWIKSCFERGLDDEIQRMISHTIKAEDTLANIATAAQRAYECGLRLKPKVPPRAAMSPASSRRTASPSHRVPSSSSSSSSSSRPRAVVHSAAARLSESQRSEYLSNDLCFNCGKPGHKTKECYSRLAAESAKGKSAGSPAKTYVKTEKVNVIEADSESDSSHYYAAPTMRIPILLPNSKGKKMLEDALIDCGASVSLIDPKTVKDKNLRTEAAPHRYRLRQAFSDQTQVASRMVREHVTIPSKDFTSKKPVPLLIAPLNHSKIVLGMPFFKQEDIGIQPATCDLIVPAQEKVLNDPVAHKPIMHIDRCKPVGPVSKQGKGFIRRAGPRALAMPPRIDLAHRSTQHPTASTFNWKATVPLVVHSVHSSKWTPQLDPESARRLHQEVVDEFPETFADKLPPFKGPRPGAPRHRIILKDPNKSINGRMFQLPERFLSHLSAFLQEHIDAGRIRPSSSNMAAGTWMIPKAKDLTAMPRVVHDYRMLNENTVKDHTPLPRQDQILRRLGLAKVLGFLDCPTAFYQMCMEDDSIHATAFKTPFGMFEWLVMPQGLCNAVATWQRFMNWVLRKYIGKICYVYSDDIAVFSNSVDDHKVNTRLVLEALREAGVIVSIKKSSLFAEKIEFLGHIISPDGLEVAASKVEKIVDWPAPRNVSEIRAFLGLVNYIGGFIPGLAQHSSLLSGLTKKGIEFEWKEAQQKAFVDIKRLVENTPVCRPISYDNPEPIFVVADASNYAIGGYYGQGKDHKTMRPAGFHSRSLNSAERNYPTHDKEMLAIIDCLKKWQPVLTGTRFDILTDHAPLTHWKTQRDLSPRQIRWNEVLAQFDADIKYIPGITNTAADALSRYPYVQDSSEEESNGIWVDIDEDGQIVGEWEIEVVGEQDDATRDEEVFATSVVSMDASILDAVRASYKEDKFFGPVFTHPERYPAYTFYDGLIFYRDRLCIPANDKSTRETLLATYHDDRNHFGDRKTRAAITVDYFWPGITNDVDAYLRSCDSCARKKSTTQAPAGFLHPLPVPTARFLEIALDFVTSLPLSKGFDTALIMTDRLTNYCKIEPLKSTATAQNVAELFYRTWYRQFGLPNAITSDRDKLFTSGFWKELFRKIAVHLRMSTSFHPETDGSSERSNKTAIESIRHYVSVRQHDWSEHLIHVELAMNNSVNATTGMTPTELLYGTPIRLVPHPVNTLSEFPAVTEFLERIDEAVALAQDRHAVAKTRQATQANKHRRADPEYKIDDSVYLSTKNLRIKVKKQGKCAKFLDRYVGPFKIIRAHPETSTYKLELPANYKIHPTFHARLLKAAVPNDPELFPEREPARPGPAFPDDEDEYEIEKILDHKDVRGKRRYLVHWLGYPTSDDQWVDANDIHAPEILQPYLDSINAAPQRPLQRPLQRSPHCAPQRPPPRPSPQNRDPPKSKPEKGGVQGHAFRAPRATMTTTTRRSSRISVQAHS